MTWWLHCLPTDSISFLLYEILRGNTAVSQPGPLRVTFTTRLFKLVNSVRSSPKHNSSCTSDILLIWMLWLSITHDLKGLRQSQTSSLFVTDEDPRGRNVSLKSVFATQMLKKVSVQFNAVAWAYTTSCTSCNRMPIYIIYWQTLLANALT